MTFDEYMAQAGKTYLRQLIAQSATMSEAATRAGKNRTDFYKVLRRFGVETVAEQGRSINRTRQWQMVSP